MQARHNVNSRDVAVKGYNPHDAVDVKMSVAWSEQVCVV